MLPPEDLALYRDAFIQFCALVAALLAVIEKASDRKKRRDKGEVDK